MVQLSGTGTLTGSSYNVQEARLRAVLAGSVGLTKNASIVTGGTNTVTISSSNTYTGVITINFGTLSISTLPDGGVVSPIGKSSCAAANLDRSRRCRLSDLGERPDKLVGL